VDDVTRSNLVGDYPAGKLPDDLRGGIYPRERVTISIAIKEGPAASFREIFESLHSSRLASNDPVMQIRALCEEWDERDRFLASICRGGSD